MKGKFTIFLFVISKKRNRKLISIICGDIVCEKGIEPIKHPQSVHNKSNAERQFGRSKECKGNFSNKSIKDVHLALWKSLYNDDKFGILNER